MKNKGTTTYRNVLASGLSGGFTPLLGMSDERLGKVSKKITGLLCREDYAPELPRDLYPISLDLAARLDKSGPGPLSLRGSFFDLAKKRYAWVMALDDEDAGWLMRSLICEAAGIDLPVYDRETPQREILAQHLEAVLKNLNRPVRSDIVKLQTEISDTLDALIEDDLIETAEKESLSGVVILDNDHPFADAELCSMLEDAQQLLAVWVCRAVLRGGSLDSLDKNEILADAQDLMNAELHTQSELTSEDSEPDESDYDNDMDGSDDDEEGQGEEDEAILLEDEGGW
ncbi:MAG: hypothetical protein HDQ87_06300 [Clostridia bacterium]|nr:hypothetical protein [Clostridia bacterium]